MDSVDTFAVLHQGGALAACWPDGRVEPLRPPSNPEGAVVAHGDAYQRTVRAHLSDDGPFLGVYPLVKEGSLWMVHWLAVDLDEGDVSLVHARNLHSLLTQLGITSWVETSRSKGYHVWVYLETPVSASVGRRAMIGACRTVNVPIREVYPKQTEVTGKGWGNCIRLPYPSCAPPGKQTMILPSTLEPIPLAAFASQAWHNRTPSAAIRNLLPLYQQTLPQSAASLAAVAGDGRDDDNFRYIAREIWGETEWRDRSESLYTFACSLQRQGFSPAGTLRLLHELDSRVGKYVGRHDREQRLTEMTDRAVREVGNAT
jgi:hypothetical protein